MAIYRVLEARLGEMRAQQWKRSALGTVAMLSAGVAGCAMGLALLDPSGEPFATKLLNGIWNAANLITTLGNFTAFDRHQKLFMVGAMVLFVGIGGYAVSKLGGLLSSEAAVAHRENRIAKFALSRMKGHVILIGFGTLGRRVASLLRGSGQAVLIIERDESLAAEASAAGYTVVQGDVGVDDAVLDSAKITDADAMVVAIEEPDRKLAITLAVRSLNPALRIIVTGDTGRRATLLKRAGATRVVDAEELIANALATQLSSASADA